MSLSDFGHWVADGLIVLGSLVITIGVVGIYRMPDVYTKLHAASKSVFLGVCSILIAIVDTGDAAIISRAVLIGLLLTLTAPVAAYEVARAAAREDWLRAKPAPPAARSAGGYAGRRAT